MGQIDIGGKMSRFLISIAKYAVDFTIKDALKVINGRKQVQKIVKEGLKNQPHSSSLHPEDLSLMIEEIQATMEKSKGIINHMNQRHHVSGTTVKGPKISKEIPNADINGSDLKKNDRKKIFIQSRL